MNRPQKLAARTEDTAFDDDGGAAPAARPLGPIARLLAPLGPDLALLFLFTGLFVALAVIYGARWNFLESSVVLPAAVAAGILGVTFVAHAPRLLRGSLAEWRAFGVRAREVARDWAPFVGLIIVYEHLYMYTGLIRHDRFDGTMLAWDRALFGVEPTVWIGRFAHPFWTDFFAFMYNMYFPLPLVLVTALALRRRREDFRELTTAIVIAMFLGFLGYTLVPVGPPRFFLEGQFVPAKLHGMFGWFELTQDAQDNLNKVKIAASFPSMHAGLSMLSLIYARRFGSIIGRPALLLGSYLFIAVALWIATVYLRHHWVVDLIAGFGVAFAAAVASPWLRRIWPTAAAT
jgi:membrane-associated phospholipid phosphatase